MNIVLTLQPHSFMNYYNINVPSMSRSSKRRLLFMCSDWNLIWTLLPCVLQALSHQLPTVAAWVRSQSMSCGICGEQSSGTAADFLRVLRFRQSMRILPTQYLSVIISNYPTTDVRVSIRAASLNKQLKNACSTTYIIPLHLIFIILFDENLKLWDFSLRSFH